MSKPSLLLIVAGLTAMISAAVASAQVPPSCVPALSVYVCPPSAFPSPTPSATQVPTLTPTPPATPTPRPSASISAAPILVGFVSEAGAPAAPYGFNACPPPGAIYIVGYGCIPVTTTGASVTGTLSVGAFFRVFGTVSGPNVTAIRVDYSNVPFPGSITPPPVATPAPSTAPSTPSVGFNTNGVSWPASFRPYEGSPVWSSPLPASPALDPNSSAIISAWFPGAGQSFPVRNQEPGPYDYTHPIYFASATDPLVTFTCQSNCSTGISAVPSTFRIPALAHSAESTVSGAGDQHIGVVQPTGTEIDIYCYGKSPCGANTFATGTSYANADFGDTCGGFYTGLGQVGPGGIGTTAAGACEGAGLLSPQQLIAGVINHALALITNCANGRVYPAQVSAGTDVCTGTGPALGARLWYDVPDATTNANSALRPWEKAILNALHDYGGYVMDDVNGGAISQGIQFIAESSEPAYRYGLSDQWSNLSAQGWTSASIPGAPTGYFRWTGADPWKPSGVNFNQHFHIVAPCVTQQTC